MTKPMFTRRHYQAVAEVLREIERDTQEADAKDGMDVTSMYRPGVNTVRNGLALMFDQDNSNFDWEDFMEASCHKTELMKTLEQSVESTVKKRSPKGSLR